jgi:hypothetical protein
MVTRGLVGGVLVAALVSACSGSDYVEPSPVSYASGAAAECAGSAGDPSEPVTADAATATLGATETFLTMLEPAQRTAVRGERTPANLGQWSDLPDQLYRRAGLRMDALDAERRQAVLAILRAALSDAGYRQVLAITTADGVLAERGGLDLDYGAEHYWIRILGVPAPLGRWTIQYGGHHLALNVTVDGPAMTLAPTLWGADPASYPHDGTTVEPLCGETRKAFALMNALDEAQRAAATLSTPVRELALGAGRDGKTLPAEGVSAATFNDGQKLLLFDLVDEWIGTLNPARATARREAVRRGVGGVTFAWSGGTTPGRPMYYRVQGPTFTVELAGDGSRVDGVYREPGADYAG